ncbi:MULTISPECIES: spore germination protein GerPC [Bacillus]|uniref:spore germination protein GerPC n=1 Tax=Bacillus TaxID=1386 RepID=UPI0002D6149F|nr:MULTISPECIES: spore germination protein GerPC [Bacillus]
MNNDFYTYAMEMKKYLENQERRIAALEAELIAINNKLKEFEAKAPVNIEKIEYKFDQLKIEKLDGTLNIGLNPAEVQELGDFTVSDQPYPIPFTTQTRTKLSKEISEDVIKFIDQNLADIISRVESEMGVKFEGQYDEFIKEDLYKQLHNRIQYYFKQFPYNESLERHDAYKERIAEQIKTDIEQAIRSFLSNLNQNTEGM